MMKAEHINPFLNATINVIETMAFCKVKSGVPAIKKDKTTWGIVSGIIGLASDKIKGSMVISFSEEAILHIVSKMLMEEFKEVNNDVVEAVGEITNMITGNAKREFSEMSIKFDMATPVMVLGKGVEIVQFDKSPTIVIPFSVEEKGFVVEVLLKEV
ncbi:MAG: chemotaxis protein CheX [Proteobacteria bacterium]|nr:chemotaxis protein CheX [Pseudomonadota bacterium]